MPWDSPLSVFHEDFLEGGICPESHNFRGGRSYHHAVCLELTPTDMGAIMLLKDTILEGELEVHNCSHQQHKWES